jgi:2-polyprenyl-3-methyl-5-hydroxy-6-metoxy-1,4-benzoquinol methylase
VTQGGCIACDRTDARPLYAVNGFAVAQCECGLARTILPAGFDPAAIYTEDYFQGGHRDGYADYEGSGAELRHEFRRILAGVRERVEGGSLLELGCALGFFLEEATPYFKTSGVEISDHARAVCTGRGLDVVRELTPEFLATRGPFDVAVMLDVLEHMSDPGSILDRLHGAMRPDGQLVVTTGDFGSLLSRAMGKRWRLMTPPQHLWFFSVETVTRFLARHGFRVHTVEHPWKLVPLALVAYQATRYLGGQGLVRRFVPPGRLPINLFDAMRVVATRIDRSALAEYALVAPRVRGRVLDLACGTGEGAALLHDRAGVTSVLGVDPAPEAIVVADQQRAKVGLEFRSCDPHTFHDAEGFDSIVSVATLEHDSDPELLIVRLIAALRVNGELIVSAPHAMRRLFERYHLVAARELSVTKDAATIVWRRA